MGNSRFVFDQVLFFAVNFHQLNLTRGSSYFPLPDWISSKKVEINPKNEEDEECFKWTILVAINHKEIGDNLQQISKLMRFECNYDWGGLEFPIAFNKICVFEENNNISVNLLAIRGEKEKLYILRKA